MSNLNPETLPVDFYMRIHTSTLKSEVSLDFDLYLYVAGKHILYVKKDDAIDESRFTKLKSRNVTHFFIRKEEEPAYRAFLERALAALRGDRYTPEKKAEILVAESKAAVAGMYEEPAKKENYTHAQNVVAIQVSHLMKHPEALAQLLRIDIDAVDKSLYQHGVNVANIAIGLASTLGATPEMCEVIGMGGLLHDIGDKRTGNDLRLAVESMTPDQKEDYENHPRQGAALLLDKKYISKDVLDIILLHHESIDGKGFPAGVKKLDQIFQVVGLANLYDKMVTFQGQTPSQAYATIAAMKPAPYMEELITGLHDVLKANKIL